MSSESPLDAPQEEVVAAGPIVEAIKKKIADLIENPQQLIALIQLLKTLFAAQEGVFSASDPEMAELKSLVDQYDA